METKKIVLGVIVLTMLLVVACTEETPLEPYTANGEIESSDEETYTNDADDVATEDVTETDDTETNDINASDKDTETANVEETVEGITRAEIAENNNAESCWVGYYGYVYDLTYWINQHPGGADEIISHCGTVEEFTEAYDNRHGQKDELNRNQAINKLI